MDAVVVEAQADGVLVGDGRLAAGDIHRVAGGAEGGNVLLERLVQVRRELHQRQPMVHYRVGQQHA